MQNQPSISIQNRASQCVIDIEGTIGIPEEWQFEHPDQRVATYERFRQTVQAIADIAHREVLVNIRSTGGDVNDALLIYEALRSTGAHITTRCHGYTASAATLIAQAASEGCREIAPEALYLIHNSICATEGNAEELAAQTDLLRKTDSRLAELYARRSGRPVGEFVALMAENNGRGCWLSPEETLAAGLADKIIASDKTPASGEGSVRNLARGWQKLQAALNNEEKKPCADERNILHFDTPAPPSPSRSSQLLERGQQGVQPTRTRAAEDPFREEDLRGSNAEAYAEDLRRLINR